jgi:hypothetical protein
MQRWKYVFIFLIYASLFGLTACGPAQTPQTPSDAAETTSDAAETPSDAAETTSGAAETTATSSDALAEALANAPEPEAGKATVVGLARSEETGEPLSNTQVWLGMVRSSEDGTSRAFAIDGARSPFDFTNEEGVFVLSNVDPDSYVLMIGDPYQSNHVIREEENPEDARVWEIPADEVYDIGEWRVDL